MEAQIVSLLIEYAKLSSAYNCSFMRFTPFVLAADPVFDRFAATAIQYVQDWRKNQALFIEATSFLIEKAVVFFRNGAM